jgi:hypothetical protein
MVEDNDFPTKACAGENAAMARAVILAVSFMVARK